MKTIKASRTLEIPDGVRVTVKSRQLRVKGPRGILTRDFSHVAVDLHMTNKGKTLEAEMWFGDRLALATIRTVITHVKNMITGVQKGYLFKMRTCYAHFPIGINIENDGVDVEVRNYLGEKIVRRVKMIGDVRCKRSDNKDEIIVSGNDLDAVSQSCANIQQISRVRDKDIRKFLDGVYVSYKGNVLED